MPAYQQDLPRSARLHVVVEKGLGADDFDRKAFATNRADCLVGGRDIAVGHGAADGGEKPLGVAFVSVLPRDKRAPRQR